MCGIAGWIDFKEDIAQGRDILESMTDTLKDRGPDGVGYYVSPHVLFGHRRLIVVDADGGKQPMQKTINGHQYALVYNGELYNTEELREELRTQGFTFESYSDTEVLLCAYICWGEDALKRLNGIFAFAVWDESEQTVFLARDPLGVKPLFYTWRNNALIFGSEIKTLLAHPAVEAVVDRDGLTELFALGPATAPGSGVFKGIYEVPPAYFLRVSKDTSALREYWKPRALENKETEAEAVEHLHALFIDAVERQLVSDVPLCTFLSGGLDSSGITAVAARVFAEQGKQLETYSIDYVDNDKYFKSSLFQPTPDQVWAEKMAVFSGTKHHTYIERHAALADALENAVLARDLPGMADIDSSLYLFCKEIRKKHVVALSGECADESERTG
ncbi:MAG TPA: asparagine synthase (glutamine-hydrolyzing) [Ruminococcaceae bacterium]|nr:asparagine synthase (glutamine-hydrolyzing) [Oscillospiraceae bacterium]